MGQHRIGAALHFLGDGGRRTGSGNAVDQRRAIDRRDVVEAVVFKLEQVRMGHHQRQRIRIGAQPAGSDEDRRRYILVDQRVQNPHVGLAHAGVESQRHARCRLAGARHVQMRFNEFDARCGGVRLRGERRGDQRGLDRRHRGRRKCGIGGHGRGDGDKQGCGGQEQSDHGAATVSGTSDFKGRRSTGLCNPMARRPICGAMALLYRQTRQKQQLSASNRLQMPQS